jgi:hypothetical protein
MVTPTAESFLLTKTFDLFRCFEIWPKDSPEAYNSAAFEEIPHLESDGTSIKSWYCSGLPFICLPRPFLTNFFFSN